MITSEFREWYDIYVNQLPYDYKRNEKSFSKKEQFEIMAGSGLNVIPHDYLWRLSAFFYPAYHQFVVYTDEHLHKGEGKKLVDIDKVYEYQLDYKLASVFLDAQAISYRLLFIGRKSFNLMYSSVYDWRSNVGDGDIVITGQNPDMFIDNEMSSIFPIWAIDYIISPENNMKFCLDLNTAPGVWGTGLQKYLSGDEIKGEFEWWSQAQTKKNTDYFYQLEISLLEKRFRNFIKEQGLCSN